MKSNLKKENDFKSELLNNKTIAFVPSGNSMWPTLKNKGQTVIVVPKTDRLKLYDVAFYERVDHSFVLHRVVEVLPKGYRMCGDSQINTEDIEESAVFGVMAGFYVGDKYIEAGDKKYRRRVSKWYSNKLLRKIILKFFRLGLKLKTKSKKTK